MRIATKVDTLRETLANEERASEQFLQETLRGIQEQIAEKHAENERLDSDIKAKREEWNNLMQPIDKNWMWFVKSEKARIEAQVHSNEKKDTDLDYMRVSLEMKLREVEEKNRSLESEKATLQKLIHEARENTSRSQATLAAAREESRKLTFAAEDRDKQSKQREQRALEHEQNNRLKENELIKTENEIQAREFKVLAKELQFYSPVQKR